MSEKITFSELVGKISAKTKQSEQSTNDFIHELAGIIETSLGAGEKISISGFGKFELHWIDEHKGRNPQTGEELTIPGQNKVVFKPYKALRERVNKPFENLDSYIIGDESEEQQSEQKAPVLSFSAKATPTAQEASPSRKPTEDDLIIERERPIDDEIRSKTIAGKSAPIDYKPSVKTTNTKEDEDLAWVFDQKKQHRDKQISNVQSEGNFNWSYTAAAVIVLIAIFLIVFLMTNQDETQTADSGSLPSQQTIAQVENNQTETSRNSAAETAEQTEQTENASATIPSTTIDSEADLTESETVNTINHSVSEGESLWSIAETEYGDPFLWPAIYDANKDMVSNPNQLSTGNSLQMPQFNDSENLASEERKMVALGYISVYDWILENQPDNARYYLWAAGSFSQEVLRDASDNVNEADLAFATQG